jgi:DegV family protein with EDD domain
MDQTLEKTSSSLDGRGFAGALHAGTVALVRERDNLDRINVFPVADADTGTNMAATLQAASERLRSGAPHGVGDAVRVAADAALDGARGNSGAILAQFLHGLALSFQDRLHVGAREFGAGAVAGSQAAWGALQSPREGTILSVLRSWSEELAARSETTQDLAEALVYALHTARRALAETPRQLAVLARHRVVDAGAQGFVYFLEGMSQWMNTGGTTGVALPPRPVGRPLFAAAHAEVDRTYRFCAEVLLSGVDLDAEQAKVRIAPLGESLVVAGGGRRLRVHVHTNAPQCFIDEAARLGVLEATKVDDMIMQQLAAREGTVALVTDSTCDLPDELVRRLGVVRVPLKLTIDGREYRDGVDMTAIEFYRRLSAASRLPTSSQPTVSEFGEVYRRLLERHEGIVSLHIAGVLSGTVDAARSAAAAIDPKRVRVIDTRKVSIGVGLLTEAAGEAIERGARLDQVEDLVLAARRSVALFGTLSSLDQAVKGGRVGKRGAWLIEAAHLHPIIVFDEAGRALKGGVALGFESALRQLVRRAAAFAGDGPARAMVVHTDRLEAAQAVAESLRSRLGVPAVPVVSGGPVVAMHVGLGCVTVAVERLGPPAFGGQPDA